MPPRPPPPPPGGIPLLTLHVIAMGLAMKASIMSGFSRQPAFSARTQLLRTMMCRGSTAIVPVMKWRESIQGAFGCTPFWRVFKALRNMEYCCLAAVQVRIRTSSLQQVQMNPVAPEQGSLGLPEPLSNLRLSASQWEAKLILGLQLNLESDGNYKKGTKVS